ncbi:MAG: Fur family transcriptional regulator [Microcella sp.]
MTSTAESRLRAAGMRVTAGRISVLERLAEAPHSDADTVHRMVAAAGGHLTLQAVHNVLADLTEAGLVRRIEPARSAARYETRIGDNHHHAVCTACGAVTDIDCVVGHAPCLVPSETGGFAIQTAEVTFWGLCPECRTLPIT